MNKELFFELDKKYYDAHSKFRWWNGAEFGTMAGMWLFILDTPVDYRFWILLCLWGIEAIMAYIYLKKIDKILKEMERLSNGND